MPLEAQLHISILASCLLGEKNQHVKGVRVPVKNSDESQEKSLLY